MSLGWSQARPDALNSTDRRRLALVEAAWGEGEVIWASFRSRGRHRSPDRGISDTNEYLTQRLVARAEMFFATFNTSASVNSPTGKPPVIRTATFPTRQM